MHRVWSVVVAAVAVVVFAVAAYVLVHDAPVHQGGRMLRLPAAATIEPPVRPTAGASGSSPPAPVVAFLGDDWTSGTGASDLDKRFSTLVSAELHLTEKNLGVAGCGYAMLGRAGGDYLSRVPQVVATDPAMVVVSGGRNDVDTNLAFAAAHAKRLFQLLRSRLPEAVVVAVPPMWGDGKPPTALHKLARSVKQAVTKAGGHYVGGTDPLRGHPGYMADADHPDDDGYAAIAAVVAHRIQGYVPQ